MCHYKVDRLRGINTEAFGPVCWAGRDGSAGGFALGLPALPPISLCLTASLLSFSLFQCFFGGGRAGLACFTVQDWHKSCGALFCRQWEEEEGEGCGISLCG